MNNENTRKPPRITTIQTIGLMKADGPPMLLVATQINISQTPVVTPPHGIETIQAVPKSKSSFTSGSHISLTMREMKRETTTVQKRSKERGLQMHCWRLVLGVVVVEPSSTSTESTAVNSVEAIVAGVWACVLSLFFRFI